MDRSRTKTVPTCCRPTRSRSIAARASTALTSRHPYFKCSITLSLHPNPNPVPFYSYQAQIRRPKHAAKAVRVDPTQWSRSHRQGCQVNYSPPTYHQPPPSPPSTPPEPQPLTILLIPGQNSEAVTISSTRSSGKLLLPSPPLPPSSPTLLSHPLPSPAILFPPLPPPPSTPSSSSSSACT